MNEVEKSRSFISLHRDLSTSLRFGQDATVNDITLSLVSIDEDSRCPSDAECIWEGTVKATVDVLKEDSVTAEFVLGESQIIFGAEIMLTDVTPATQSDVSLDLSDY